MQLETNGSLTLRFEGWERWLSLRSVVTIPRDAITSIAFHADYQDPGGAWRSGGTAAPGILYAGRFRRHGKREVWYLRKARGLRRVRAQNVLEIVSDVPDATRLLLTMDPVEADAIIAWSRQRPSATA